MRLTIAELYLVGVGQALDGRFTVFAAVIIAPLTVMLEAVVLIGGLAVEDAAEPQHADRAAEHDEAEHTEKKELQPLPAARRRRGVFFLSSGEGRWLYIALHDGRGMRFIAQHDLLRLDARPVVFDGMIHGGVLLWGDVTAGQDRLRA